MYLYLKSILKIKNMKQLLMIYNETAEQLGDLVFKHIIPPTLKIIEIGLKITLAYAFYLLILNGINELL